MAGQDLTTLLGLKYMHVCILGARRHVRSGLHLPPCGMRVIALRQPQAQVAAVGRAQPQACVAAVPRKQVRFGEVRVSY